MQTRGRLGGDSQMKNIYIIFFSAVFIFISCKSFQVGEYKNTKTSERIILKNDSTFIYNNYSLNFEYSSGIWKRRGNKIILDSRIKNKIVPVEIYKFENMISKDRISIKVNIISLKNNPQDYFCETFTNNEILLFNPLDSLKPLLNKKPVIDIQLLSKYIQEKNGSYSFSINHHIDSLYFRLWKFPQSINGMNTDDSIQTTKKRILANLGDSITANILLCDSLFGYKVFDNNELIYRNGCLIFENNKLKASNKYFH